MDLPLKFGFLVFFPLLNQVVGRLKQNSSGLVLERLEMGSGGPMVSQKWGPISEEWAPSKLKDFSIS